MTNAYVYIDEVMCMIYNEFLISGPKRSNPVRKNDSSYLQSIDTVAEPLPRDVRHIVHNRAVII